MLFSRRGSVTSASPESALRAAAAPQDDENGGSGGGRYRTSIVNFIDLAG